MVTFGYLWDLNCLLVATEEDCGSVYVAAFWCCQQWCRWQGRGLRTTRSGFVDDGVDDRCRRWRWWQGRTRGSLVDDVDDRFQWWRQWQGRWWTCGSFVDNVIDLLYQGWHQRGYVLHLGSLRLKAFFNATCQPKSVSTRRIFFMFFAKSIVTWQWILRWN